MSTGAVPFQWSTDGTTWNNVTYTQVTYNASWALVNGETRITLPSGAAGVTNLRFRWTGTASNNGNFRIDVNGHQILAYTSGNMRKNKIKITVEDRVSVELSPYDLTRGRITYRYK